MTNSALVIVASPPCGRGYARNVNSGKWVRGWRSLVRPEPSPNCTCWICLSCPLPQGERAQQQSPQLAAPPTSLIFPGMGAPLAPQGTGGAVDGLSEEW